MRVLLVGVAVLGLVGQASAADMPLLRGSAYEGPPAGFAGFYVGLQGGAAIGSGDFTSDNEHNRLAGLVSGMLNSAPQTAAVNQQFSLANSIQLNRVDTTGQHYGGFVGYNTPWEEGILGIELNYSYTSLNIGSADFFHGTFLTADQYANTIGLLASSNVLVRDYATLRARAGWQLGCFLPYAFAGLAVARADISHSATASMVSVDATNPPLPVPRPTINTGPLTASDLRENAFGYGVALGMGVDVMLSSNFFLRAEYEYVALQRIQDENVHLSTARAAVGVKF